MALFIRDEEVAAMAAELARITNAKSKTDAVRLALAHELDRTRNSVPLRERLEKLQAKASKLGLPNRAFDMKAHSDEMWEEQ